MLSTQPSLKVDRALDDGDAIETPVGLQVIHTPGHTPGNICLYQLERRILFCGDALSNRHPLTSKEGLQFPLPMASVDWDQARASVRKLAALQIEVLLPGHGEPILGEVGDRIRMLLEQELA
jgi:glyoxylase-like metal-dependent hydrolase (beta-lactamase superfamily II)